MFWNAYFTKVMHSSIVFLLPPGSWATLDYWKLSKGLGIYIYDDFLVYTHCNMVVSYKQLCLICILIKSMCLHISLVYSQCIALKSGDPTYIQLLERIQRRATKFVLNNNSLSFRHEAIIYAPKLSILLLSSAPKIMHEKMPIIPKIMPLILVNNASLNL